MKIVHLAVYRDMNVCVYFLQQNLKDYCKYAKNNDKQEEMKESKAVYVTKHKIRDDQKLVYHLYRSEWGERGRRFDRSNFGSQFDSKREHGVCTCKNTLRKRYHDFKYFSGLPKQIYAYHGSRRFVDIGVGSVKTIQRNKVKRIYLPETDDTGVGSSDLSSFILRKRYPKVIHMNSYYDHKKTSSKCIGGILEYNTGCVINQKLSPIIHTKSGATSPKRSIILKRDTEIGSSTIDKKTETIGTQFEETERPEVTPIIQEITPIVAVSEIQQLIIPEIKLETKLEPISEPKPEIKPDTKPETKPVVKVSEYTQKTKHEESEVNKKTEAEKNRKEGDKTYSSDSLVQHVHNLEIPSDDKHSRTSFPDPMENKLEREYRKMFSTTKSKDSKPSCDKPIPEFKSASILRRRFEALRRGIVKKDESNSKKKDSLLMKTSHGEVPMRKDASVTSDPPSLISRSFSGTEKYKAAVEGSKRDKGRTSPSKKERRSEWQQPQNSAESETQGVKGMFKLWGKKFNFEEDAYGKRQATPMPSYDKSKKTEKEPAKFEMKDSRKDNKKFFFFKKKSKEKAKNAGLPKKDVTAGRCEIKDGFVLKIGDTGSSKVKSGSSEEGNGITHKAWMRKFMSETMESARSVNIRWNNSLYATSSSTVFELLDSVYKNTNVILSQSDATTAESSYFKSFTKQVNFVQDIEAWMIPKTITDRPIKQIPIRQLPPHISSERDMNKKSIEFTTSDQKWYIEKSEAFSHKIEVVLHSNNTTDISDKKTSSEYLRIDIPGDFFDTSSDESKHNHSSDEEVYKIVEYETNSEIGRSRKTLNDLIKGDHLSTDIKVIVSVKDSKNLESKILETVIKRPPANKDVVIQGNDENDSQRCDVIGVGIITQRDLRKIRKPILKIRDDTTDDESEPVIQSNQKKCGFAESYLHEYYRHWTPFGADLYPWCVSDSHVRSSSEKSLASTHNPNDGSKSCPNIYEDPEPTIITSCETSNTPCKHGTYEEIYNKMIKKFKKPAKAKTDSELTKTQRIQPKDSLEVFKRRKINEATARSQWAKFCLNVRDVTCSVPSVHSKGCCSTENSHLKKQKSFPKPKAKFCNDRIMMPDCDGINDSLIKQFGGKPMEGILNLKKPICDGCKPESKCAKNTVVNPIPCCETPQPPCKVSNEMIDEKNEMDEQHNSKPNSPPRNTATSCKNISPIVSPVCSKSSLPPEINVPPPQSEISQPDCKSPVCPAKKPSPEPSICSAEKSIKAPPCHKPPCCSPPSCETPPLCASPPPRPAPQPECNTPPCHKTPPTREASVCCKNSPCYMTPPPDKKTNSIKKSHHKKSPSCTSPSPCKSPQSPAPSTCDKPPPVTIDKLPTCHDSEPCKISLSCSSTTSFCFQRPQFRNSNNSPSCPATVTPPCCTPKKECPSGKELPTCNNPCKSNASTKKSFILPWKKSAASCCNKPSPPCCKATIPSCSKCSPRSSILPWKRSKSPSCKQPPSQPPCNPPSCSTCCKKPPPSKKTSPIASILNWKKSDKTPMNTSSCCDDTSTNDCKNCCKSSSSSDSCVSSDSLKSHSPCVSPQPTSPCDSPKESPCSSPKGSRGFSPKLSNKHLIKLRVNQSPKPSPKCSVQPSPKPSPKCVSKPSPKQPPKCSSKPSRKSSPKPPPKCSAECSPKPSPKPSAKCSPTCFANVSPIPSLEPASKDLPKPSLIAPLKYAPRQSPKPSPEATPKCSPECFAKPKPPKKSPLPSPSSSKTGICLKQYPPPPSPPKPPKPPKKKVCNLPPCDQLKKSPKSEDVKKKQSCGEEFPWPTKNQVSYPPTPDCDSPKAHKCENECNECPPSNKVSPSSSKSSMFPGPESFPEPVFPPKESLRSQPEPLSPKSAPSPDPPCPHCLSKIQRPPSPPGGSKSKISGLFLKIKPAKKKSCAVDCTGWDEMKPSGTKLCSRDNLTIRIKESPPSIDEVREPVNIKVQDEDGRTLYERKDYTCSNQHEAVLEDLYKESKINRLTPMTVTNMVENDDKKDLTSYVSDKSLLNSVEINFKLRITQGDKTTEIDIGNKDEKPNHRTEPNQSHPEVFIVNNGRAETIEENPTNDINIKITLRNFKPKQKSNISKERKRRDDFSNKISDKFQTVSTGYSDVEDDNVFSIHRATINLGSSPEVSQVCSKTHGKEQDCATSLHSTDVVTDITEEERIDEKPAKNIEQHVTLEESRTNESLLHNFNGTDTEEDVLTGLNTSNDNSNNVMSKRASKEQKKELLKKVFQKAGKRSKNKENVRELRDMLKVILTDSSDDDATNASSNELAKDVTYTSLKPNYFRDTDSLNNYYHIDGNMSSKIDSKIDTVYPTEEVNSKTSQSCDMEDNDVTFRGCMCSKVAEKLNQATANKVGCCCRQSLRKDEETNCDIRNAADYFLLNYKTTEFVDVETQDSLRLASKVNSYNISVHSSKRKSFAKTSTDIIKIEEIKALRSTEQRKSRSVTQRESLAKESMKITEVTEQVRTLKSPTSKRVSRNVSHRLSIAKDSELRHLYQNTDVEGDEVSRKLTALSIDNNKESKKSKQSEKSVKDMDILQSYAAKKAVLEIYAEKAENSDNFVAKLPKFVAERESEMTKNFEQIATNSYRTVLKENVFMMSVKR